MSSTNLIVMDFGRGFLGIDNPNQATENLVKHSNAMLTYCTLIG